jgi:hypothetical protein
MNSSSSRPTAGKDLDLENLLSRFLDLTIHQEVPKLFSQQELRGLVDKTPGQQTKDRQFESSGFQDRQSNQHERHLVAASKTTKMIKQQSGSVDSKKLWKSLALQKLSPIKKYFFNTPVVYRYPEFSTGAAAQPEFFFLLAWYEFLARKIVYHYHARNTLVKKKKSWAVKISLLLHL